MNVTDFLLGHQYAFIIKYFVVVEAAQLSYDTVFSFSFLLRFEAHNEPNKG